MTNPDFEKAVEIAAEARWNHKRGRGRPWSTLPDGIKQYALDAERQSLSALLSSGYVLAKSDADARERAVEALVGLRLTTDDGKDVATLQRGAAEACVKNQEAAGVAFGPAEGKAALPQSQIVESNISHNPAPGWRPIESAPKDGRPILACWDSETGDFDPVAVRWIDAPGEHTGWWDEDLPVIGLTHWQPIDPQPSPPEEDADGE